MKLWQKVLIGIVTGIVLGHFLHNYPNILEIINIGGQVFMRLMRMLMGPIIFCVICSGMLSIPNIKTFSAVGLRIVSLSLFNTCFAVVFGIIVAIMLQPGKNFNQNLIDKSNNVVNLVSFSLKDFICNFVPDNILDSFVKGSLLQIVFFALFTGIICQVYKKHCNNVKNKVRILSDILFFMMEKIMLLSPYGAFCLMTYSVGMQGINILFSLSKLILALLIAMFLQYWIFGLTIIIFCKKSPIPFYKKSVMYQILAFSVSSSKLVLPKTMQICKASLGMSDFGSQVALPLASAFNITGSGIQLGISAIFFAQIYNIELFYSHYCYIVFLSTIGAMGCGGVPGLSLVILPIILDAIGIPAHGIGILLGIDRLLDMVRTTINLTGDVAAAIVVDHSEKTMNWEIYSNKTNTM